MNTVFIRLIETGFSQEEIDNARKFGEGLNAASTSSEFVGDVVGSIAMFSNFDPTGSMFKL
jgi:hypothetical protein